MDKGEVYAICVVIFMVGAIGLVIFSGAQHILSFEKEQIDGYVTEIELYEDYMEITFNNDSEQTFNIAYPSGYNSELDLTVNSKLILKLSKDSFWMTPNVNNIWKITSVVKVPGD